MLAGTWYRCLLSERAFRIVAGWSAKTWRKSEGDEQDPNREQVEEVFQRQKWHWGRLNCRAWQSISGVWKTCLDIMGEKERVGRTKNLGPDWVELACRTKGFVFIFSYCVLFFFPTLLSLISIPAKPQKSWWGEFMSSCVSDLSPIPLSPSWLPDSGLQTLSSSVDKCASGKLADLGCNPLPLISCMDMSKWLHCSSLSLLIFKMGKLAAYWYI